MIDQNTSTEIFDAIAKRRGERRNFMKVAGGATAAFGLRGSKDGGDLKYFCAEHLNSTGCFRVDKDRAGES